MLIVTATRNGVDDATAQITITITDVSSDNTTFSFNGVTYSSVTSATGRTWLDRNLGASQVATAIDDADGFGDLYQWGRPADGHQLRNAATSATLADSITPNSASFITGSEDWTTIDSAGTLRVAAWSSFNGSGICPIGYRVPTEDELLTERDSWLSQDGAGAFASSFNLPRAGFRSSASATTTVSSVLWSTTTSSDNKSKYLTMSEDDASSLKGKRESAYSVRCILNEGSNPVPDSVDPLTIANQTREIAENTASGTAVGAALVTTGNPTTFSITAGNTGNAFAIDNDGQITVANGVLDFEAKQIYTLIVRISKNGTASKIAQITINITDVDETFPFNSVRYSPVISATGRTWLDRNLGASQVATSITDAAGFGDLYQWGRRADGHQLRTSAAITTQANSITPNSADYINTSSNDYGA